ncbi:hypothetical protein [Salana multivorans]
MSALALALTACAADGDEPRDSPETLTQADSPLDAYYGGLWDSIGMADESTGARRAERQRRYEDLKAQCRAEQGFDYTPYHWPEGASDIETPEDEGTEQSQVAYAQQYGYDVFTRDDEEPVAEEEPEPEDPNAWVREELSEAEPIAWEEALRGPAPDADAPLPEGEWDTDTEWRWEDKGCSGWAEHQLEGDNPFEVVTSLMEQPQFAELFEEMNNVYQEAETDPRFAELDDAWSECMVDEGYDFATPLAARESIYELKRELRAGHEDDPDYAGPSAAESAGAREQEIATAVADYTCQEKLGYESEQLRVRFDAEQAFIDANKERLDQFAAAVEAAVPAS